MGKSSHGQRMVHMGKRGSHGQREVHMDNMHGQKGFTYGQKKSTYRRSVPCPPLSNTIP